MLQAVKQAVANDDDGEWGIDYLAMQVVGGAKKLHDMAEEEEAKLFSHGTMS